MANKKLVGGLDTAARIDAEIARLQVTRERPSVAEFARRVGTTPANLSKNYPDKAADVRAWRDGADPWSPTPVRRAGATAPVLGEEKLAHERQLVARLRRQVAELTAERDRARTLLVAARRAEVERNLWLGVVADLAADLEAQGGCEADVDRVRGIVSDWRSLLALDAPPLMPAAGGEPAEDPVYQLLFAYMRDFAREMNDAADLMSTTSRAYNLFRASGMPLRTFIQLLYYAKMQTQYRLSNIRNAHNNQTSGMAYLFGVLQNKIRTNARANASDSTGGGSRAAGPPPGRPQASARA
ncbi:MAG TPA: hypothetical protein VFC93_15905 [Chloroflexota bacterium]|nr:hypothetical protein [Chloroflexota bacterium]